MRKTILTIVLAVLAFGSLSTQAAQTGSVVGWGSQVVGVDLSSSFIAIAAGGSHSLGLKDDGSVTAWGNNYQGRCNIPAPNSGFVAISAGGYHSLGLKGDGSVVAWGLNDDDQCNVPDPNGFIAIAAGRFHSLGLKVDGSVEAWGDNGYGQCDVPDPNGFIAIAAGYYHSLGLKEDGSVVAWGYNGDGQCNVPTPNSGFVAISVGRRHSLALKNDGSVVAWGDEYRQCPDPNGFVAISAGWYHSLGLKDDGSIVAWGTNFDGQCNVPTPNSGFIAIAAGNDYSLGLKEDGSVVAWGDNGGGKCNVPAPNSGFIAISSYYRHNLGLKDDGTARAWGWNEYNQCNVPDSNDFVGIAAGGYHSLGLKDDGSVAAWGYNYWDQRDVPAPNSGFTAIAAGSGHSLGLKDDGTIVAWGLNNYGQCNVPDPNSGFIDIAAGYYHSLGLKEDGSIVAWGIEDGSNYDFGQCNVPSPNSGFIAIGAGWYHSLGLKPCLHKPIGDIDDNCRVDLRDLALICDQWLINYFFSDVVDVAENWLAGTGNLTIELTLDNLWMYQNLPGQILSNLTANISIVDDPEGNSSYTYIWEFILPPDVIIEPSTIGGGEAADTSFNFAAPGCNESGGLSDSGSAFTVKVTVIGDDYENTGSAEAQFGIALLGDVNNDTAVNIADRNLINAFWQTGAAGDFTFIDCNINCYGPVNVADYNIANAVWQGQLGQNSVSSPCPFRHPGMAFIPDGEFEMGDHFEPEGSSNELPVHSVWVDSFFMGKFEITNQQYCDYLNSALGSGSIYLASDNVYGTGNDQIYCDTWENSAYSLIVYSGGVFSLRTKGGRDMSDDPMVMVSWYGTAAYCNWRSSEEGYESCYDSNDPNWPCDFSKNGYRLATEAEWEYAARGGEHSPYYRYPWGDTIDGSRANYSDSGDPYETGDYPWTTPVGYYDGSQIPTGSDQANGYGLYDMAGNVWEWCNDWWDEDYYDISPYDNPQGPANSPNDWRVLRGGGWSSLVIHCRVSDRGYNDPDYRRRNFGFRIVLDLN